MPRTRRRFTAEFKAEAIKLLEESGRALPEVAEELGVHANQLRTWRNEHLAAGSAEALARGLVRVDRRGEADGPAYHPLHPEVGEALKRRVVEALAPRRMRPSLTGLLIRLGPGPTLLGGPDTGLEVGPGEFVWRPAGSRHVAWCPKGGTMIAIFQVPNKFFEKDGKVTDAGGKDWQSSWGHILSN